MQGLETRESAKQEKAYGNWDARTSVPAFNVETFRNHRMRSIHLEIEHRHGCHDDCPVRSTSGKEVVMRSVCMGSGLYGAAFKALSRIRRLIAFAAAATLLALLALPASAAPPPAKDGYADLAGVKLWYTDSGGYGPVVVLLHANTGTSETWKPQIGPLSAGGYRVIAFDRRG